MKITRTSPLTGNTATKEIAVTSQQIAAWEGGELAQNAFPNASPSEREFIMSGYTDFDWDEMFREIDDES
jgi:hypothetical protein